jgi:hypothetical protein
MSAFYRSGPLIQVLCTELEITVLTSLVQQLTGLLEGDSEPLADDPFARWQAELSHTELDFSDPVLARLFPEAQPGDDDASAEFRRLTVGRQRQERLGNASIVLDELEANDAGVLEIAVTSVDAWLKTLNSIRLSLAVRLGIETVADQEVAAAIAADDPRSFVYSLYEWTAYFIEELLSVSG